MQLYANKTENLEEMDKFLEKYNLPRLNQDEIAEQSQVLKLELWLKNFQQTSPAPDGFTGEFYQTFREELTPLLLKLFQQTAEERDTPKLILWGHHHPDTKTRQRYHEKRKLQANFTDEHQCKNPQQNTSKPHPTIH